MKNGRCLRILLSNISCGSAHYSANLQSTTDLEGRLPASLSSLVPLLSSHHLSSSVLSSPPPHLSNTSIVTITEFDLERATVLLTWLNILAHCRCSAITGHLRNSAFCDNPFAPPTKPLQVTHHDLLHRLFKEHQVEELPWIRFICHLYDHRS